MDIYPFFLECSKYEIGSRRKQLQQLAIGCGGLIIRNSMLFVNDETFKIPIEFSENDRNALVRMLWPDDQEFFHLQNTIKESNKFWKNSKKKNRLRLIDGYVLNQCALSKREKILLKATITMAVILKLISSKQIDFSDYAIKDISGISASNPLNCSYAS